MPREFRSEFSWSADEVARAERWGAFASELTTNLHEIIGHGSGLVSPLLNGAPEKALKEQFSAIEEARADLVALYFVADPYLVEIGVVRDDALQDIVLAEYEAYARNALVQLRRIREGAQIEEDHMRNRQLIVHWLLANTEAIQIASRDGKTFYRMVDAAAFREGVGRLLGRGAAHQGGRRLRRGERAGRDLRRPLRSRAARRGRPPGRPAGPAVVQRVRDAEAGARHPSTTARSPT